MRHSNKMFAQVRDIVSKIEIAKNKMNLSKNQSYAHIRASISLS